MMILMHQKGDEGLDEAVEVGVERDPFESHCKVSQTGFSGRSGGGERDDGSCDGPDVAP